MNKFILMMIVTGVLFSVWPRYMTQSGLIGSVSSAFFALGCLIIVMPFALYTLKTNSAALTNINWKYVSIACVLAAAGLLFFNGTLAVAPKAQMGSLFLTMLMTQVVTTAVIEIYKAGTVTPGQLAGFASAAFTVYVLT